jgi:hypothetical protein
MIHFQNALITFRAVMTSIWLSIIKNTLYALQVLQYLGFPKYPRLFLVST